MKNTKKRIVKKPDHRGDIYYYPEYYKDDCFFKSNNGWRSYRDGGKSIDRYLSLSGAERLIKQEIERENNNGLMVVVCEYDDNNNNLKEIK